MEENNVQKEILEKVEELIKKIKSDGINANNLDHLMKLEDIHYKIKKEEHMKEEDNMRYGNYYGTNYDNYGARRRDSDGRYMDSGNYGRRGYDSRYRGNEMIDAMSENYGRYMENVNYGNYGSPETDKSFNYMIKEWKKFGMYIGEEAQEPQHKQMLREAAEEVARNV